MKKAVTLALVVCLILLVAVTTAPDTRGMMRIKTREGETIQLYGGSYALVIGNGDYQKGWDKLTGAVSDAMEVAEALEKHGFQVTLKTNVTKDEFDREFGQFAVNYGRDKDNRLLFYYAGHGHTEKMTTGDELGYIVMVDTPTSEADPVEFGIKSVDMVSLVTRAKMINARHVLFMFDSCFSGSIMNLRKKVTPPDSISEDVRYPVRQFITAGDTDEPVPDHSVFKQAFLDLIEGRDREPFIDGYITGEELGYYLKHKVPEYNPMQHPQYGKIRDPKLDKGDFVFQLAKPPITPPSASGMPKIKIGRDGAPMVLIPAGDFEMGSNDEDNEKPVHTVYLDDFYMDVYEVTNAQYKKFMDATGHKEPGYWNDPKYNDPHQPVVRVTWHDAKAYCEWAGKRLPTEAEWEKAAREGLMGRKFPWGDNLNHEDANYQGTGGRDRWTYTAPVGSFAPNGYGLHDMAGNVCEWCMDWYDLGYYAKSPRRNPMGPNLGTERVLRGGSWSYNTFTILRVASRGHLGPSNTGLSVGFRCAWDFTSQPPADRRSEHLIDQSAPGVQQSVIEMPKSKIGKDGAEMALIPAGEFQMGSNDGESDEKPVHMVYVDAFYMDKYEVTNAQYRQFVKATGHREPEGIGYVNGKYQRGFKPWSDKNFNGDDQPVVCVSWDDATAYCKWAGKRLPTEAEWEKAARGGLMGSKYIWGDAWPPPRKAGNFAGETAKKVLAIWSTIKGYDDGYAYSAPVGSFDSNVYGLYDMAGNAWEWCSDWYDKSHYVNSPNRNPTGSGSGTSRVLRGGSCYVNNPNYLRVAYRIGDKPPYTLGLIGFRCAGL